MKGNDMRIIDPSRRRFLAAGSAATVFASLHQAMAAESTNPDQAIFDKIAEIQRYDALIGEYGSLCDRVAAKREGRTILPEHEALRDGACENYWGARYALFAMVPQTMRGVRAMIEAIPNECALDEAEITDLHANLLRSPALAI